MSAQPESMHFNVRLGECHAAVVDATVWDNGSSYLLTRVNVPAPYRGQGVGTQLMAKMLAWADAGGWPLHLQVSPYGDSPMQYDALVAWYKRLGFMQDGDTPLMMRCPAPVEPAAPAA